MAKKDKKKSKKKDTPGADAVGAVRSAVEKTFHATADSAQSTRTRAQDLVDEVAAAAARVREMIEQVGVMEDLKGLRGEVEGLARRVAQLEGSRSSKPATSTRSTASKPAARKSAARKPASSRAKRASSSRSTSRSTSSRSTSSRSTASKSSGTRKPSTRSSAAKKPS
jgi:polyhydroxyalkanoate synthesis regulator phasin